MQATTFLLMSTCMVCIFSSAIPKQDEKTGKEKRVHEQTLSDSEHFSDNNEHNPDFDHEAFLGERDAEEFDHLPPEESKKRLGFIFDKIDSNNDGMVTEEELKDWIKRVQTRYIIDDTERQWKEMDLKEEDKVTWDYYLKKTYGADDLEGGEQFADMQRRDKRRWEKADGDEDSSLSKKEYMDFLHPEEADHMKEVVVDETMEDIDKDKDGYISIEEYIEDVQSNGREDDDEEDSDWLAEEHDDFATLLDKTSDGRLDRDEVAAWILPESEDTFSDEARHLLVEADEDEVVIQGDMWPKPDEEEPDWVKNERDQFAASRDHDKDGKMNRKEVRDWILPDDYDHTEAEAKHLIYESDSNKDDKLSKEEVLDKYDLFVGSQATDFGEVLTRHDEF